MFFFFFFFFFFIMPLKLHTFSFLFPVAVVVAFFLCWAPFHAQRLLTIYIHVWTPALHKLQSTLFYISGRYNVCPKMAANTKWYAVTRLNTKWLRHSCASFREKYYFENVYLEIRRWRTCLKMQILLTLMRLKIAILGGISTENAIECNLT